MQAIDLFAGAGGFSTGAAVPAIGIPKSYPERLQQASNARKLILVRFATWQPLRNRTNE